MFRDDSFKSVKVGDLGRAFGVGSKLSQLVGNVAFSIVDSAVKYLSKMRGFDSRMVDYNFIGDSFD